MKFEKIKPGDVLLDIHKHRMGNTTAREWGLWKVRIISVDAEKRTAVVSWNSNPPKTWYQRDLVRLKTKPTKAYLEQERRKEDLRRSR